jgi:hypothetical protein
MSKKAEICPICGEPDKTLKVSQVYLESISNKELIEGKNKKSLRVILQDDEGEPFKGRFSTEFIKAFSPPSGKTAVFRSVHPDQVMVALFLLSIFFLYNIYLQQPGTFWIAAVVFAILVIFYIAARKSIIAKYQKSKDENAQSNERVKKSIKYWMELYYCARDKVIYHPQRNEHFPIGEMKSYLSNLE